MNVRAVLAEEAPDTLSAYRFFTDAGARAPNQGVTPYELNTALYSDGALKFRYLYLPPGTQASYREEGVFEFPIGAVLIKTFALAADMRTHRGRQRTHRPEDRLRRPGRPRREQDLRDRVRTGRRERRVEFGGMGRVVRVESYLRSLRGPGAVGDTKPMRWSLAACCAQAAGSAWPNDKSPSKGARPA